MKLLFQNFKDIYAWSMNRHVFFLIKHSGILQDFVEKK